MTKKPHIPPSPAGYQYHQPLFADWDDLRRYPFWILLVWANLIALLPLTAGIFFLWLPYQIYRLSGAPFALFPHWTLPLPGMVAGGLLIILTSMLIHEWLHGLALTWAGHQPRYAFNRFYLLATIEPGTYLNRSDYLVMTLTPLLVISIGGGLALIFLPPVVGQLWLIALLLNTAASVGDLLVAQRLMRAPADALFTDDRGIQVFIPIPVVAAQKNIPGQTGDVSPL